MGNLKRPSYSFCTQSKSSTGVREDKREWYDAKIDVNISFHVNRTTRVPNGPSVISSSLGDRKEVAL